MCRRLGYVRCVIVQRLFDGQISAELAAYVELKGLVDVPAELAKKAKKIKQLEGAIKKYENIITRGASKMSAVSIVRVDNE